MANEHPDNPYGLPNSPSPARKSPDAPPPAAPPPDQRNVGDEGTRKGIADAGLPADTYKRGSK